MKKVSSIQQEAWQEAINIVDGERKAWEDATCYVTENVGFRMRELIRYFRKYYWGVFDQPIDPNTGRDKLWIGLAQSIVEDIWKNVDIDQKDLGFRAKNEEAIPLTEITRLYSRDYLRKMYFGEILDADQRQALIDGTLVWKVMDKKKGKRRLKIGKVDLLNFYINPEERSIYEAYRVTERSIIPMSAYQSMSGWENKDGSAGSTNLSMNDPRSPLTQETTGPYRDVWEMWGKIPKWLVTLNKEADDAYDEVDGHIVVSGIESNNLACNLIEVNKNVDEFGIALKPYEELRYRVVGNRWYGLGAIEPIMQLQEYLNIVTNVRANRSIMSQSGLFKIKKGKGITAQSLAKLPTNGAIPVQDMDDIQQMPVQDVPVSSYKDEDVIVGWAQKITSAYPVATGEILPSSATATSVAISNTNAKSAYTIYKEAMGSFLTRVMDRHALPIISTTLSVNDIITLTSSDEKFKEIVERVAMWRTLDKMETSEYIPTEQELEAMIDAEAQSLMRQPQVFIRTTQKIVADQLETVVQITNEDLDTSVSVANLLQLLSAAPEYKEYTVKTIYDLLGLQTPPTPKQPEMPEGQMQEMQPQELPTVQNMTEEALVTQ